MNVYDFDGTIYKKDSSIEFYLYVIKTKPSIFIKCFPHQFILFLAYKLGLVKKEIFKQAFFSFLKYIDGYDMVKKFVSKEMKNVKEWYLKQLQKNDIIISASPEFLIKEFAINLGIYNVIASRIDINTGTFYGLNCYGVEKVSRFKEKHQLDKIDEFYSDSTSDAPLAYYAKKAFRVTKDNITEWRISEINESKESNK